MATYPAELRYTREHEWAKVDGKRARVGITHYAQDQLGDVVFVELPAVGKALEAGKPFGVVEAVKTVSDLYAPVAGEVVEVNGSLADNPAEVNQAPFGAGWMIRVRPANPDDVKQLLDHQQYAQLIEEQHA